MLKKKLPFKEDKAQLNKIKLSNEKNISEESNKLRGRQLFSKEMEMTHKSLMNMNMNVNSIKLDSSSHKGNNSKTKKEENHKIISNKSNNKYYTYKIEKSYRFNSNNYYADSFEIDEEYQSSDSECSIRNNRKRILLEDKSELPENLKEPSQIESLNNSQQEILENYEIGDEFSLTYGDNLTNEVERILIDIYNNHVSVNFRKKIEITKYEKHIKIFSKSLNRQYNIFILQILSDKIKELINRYKVKIFEIPEIKQIRDRYYDIKASMINKKLESQDNNTVSRSTSKDKDLKYCGDSDYNTLNIESSVGINLNERKNLNNLTNINTNTTESSNELNDCDKSVTKILLLELKKIKKLLLDSSKDIQKVFKLPLSHLVENEKIVQFNVVEMHREEFVNTMLKDEFIDALIIQIRTIANELKIEEIHFLLSHIEEDPNTTQEMTRFSAFLFSQLKSLIESDCENEDNTIDISSSNSSGGTHTTLCKTNSLVNSTSKYYTTNSTSIDNSSSPTNKVTKISKDIGIDELVEYIQKPEVKQKKNKKKKKSKKTKQIVEIFCRYDDVEVENFKKLIYEDSRHMATTIKIRPIISQEWLQNISKLVKAE